MSIPYMISACSSPFIGAAIDRFGCRALLAALCPLILILTHLGLGVATGLPPTLPLIGQGVGYSVRAPAPRTAPNPRPPVRGPLLTRPLGPPPPPRARVLQVFGAALWPTVPMTIPASYEGLAFGMVTAVQNGGLGGFPLLVSAIYKMAGEAHTHAHPYRAPLPRATTRPSHALHTHAPYTTRTRPPHGPTSPPSPPAAPRRCPAGERYIPYVELLFVGFATTGFLSGLFLNCYDAGHNFELNRVQRSSSKSAESVEPLEAVRESISRGTSP